MPCSVYIPAKKRSTKKSESVFSTAPSIRIRHNKSAIRTDGASQTIKKASQSLRPQAQIKFKAFLPAACTSAKIPLGSQPCERKRVRCGEPQPFPTRAQRSGSRLRACQKYFLTRSAPDGFLIHRALFIYQYINIAEAGHAVSRGRPLWRRQGQRGQTLCARHGARSPEAAPYSGCVRQEPPQRALPIRALLFP